MFSTLLTIALIVAPALQGVLADFAVNTPSINQCKDVKISWEATKGPYNLIVVPAENPCEDVLADLGDHDSTTFTWTPKLAPGTKVQLSVEDADGDEAWSGQITIGKGDTSCIQSDKSDPSPTTSAIGGTTMVVPPNAGNPTTIVELTTSSIPSAVGAAGNAGANPFASNSAVATRHATLPVMVLGAFAAILASSL
ncbi:hypothetical protein BDZ94DRAFT_1274884 [Collybia nuda]|uniref:Uncharacterized protein n=1 Tax=Collybia nuda TaxID=64659 RepID=A0A9P5XTW6_9AGAR|nr:hypothetical protein BDZ94DRAFT_1274884 [Collybia nuda]